MHARPHPQLSTRLCGGIARNAPIPQYSRPDGIKITSTSGTTIQNGFTSSAVKLTNALNIQEGDELLVAAMGPQGFRWDPETADGEELASLQKWLYQKSLTIAGGTKEVQLNIIAKRVLGLPD